MVLSKNVEKPTKFIIEYKNISKDITDRWHYDLSRSKNGPILTENFELPQREKAKKVVKKTE